jgi:hypothetical protein
MITEHEQDEAQLNNFPQYFKVPAVARRLSLSRTKVTELFEFEEGVVVLSSAKRGKRGKRTLLIPEAAIARVLAKLARHQ